MIKKGFGIIIVCILILSFVLRFINISTNPPALYGDELTLVYDGYSILKTGKDQTGAFLPLTFTMSEGRPPVYVYFSLPFIALFGPTELAVRLLSVMSGVGIVFIIFLLGKKLISQEVGIAGAFLAAVLPWDLSLSRGGFEAHFALFLFLLGLMTFLKGKEKPYYYIFSAIAFGLTLHTYHSYKVVTPLFIVILLIYSFLLKSLNGFFKNKLILLSMAVFILLVVVWVMQVVQGVDIRYKNTNIFSDEKINSKIIEKINHEREISYLPPELSSLFHNKVLEYSKLVMQNYWDNFSPEFLLISGDKNPRHNPGETGGIFLVQLLLMPLGVITLSISNRKFLFLILGWLLVAPLSTAVVSGAHAIRSSAMIPPLIIFSAVGLISILKLFSNKYHQRIALSILITVILAQFIVIAERVYFLSPIKHCPFWSCAAKQASLIAQEEKANYKYVILSSKIDNGEHAFPVYTQVDPSQVMDQYDKFTEINNYKFKKFDNVYIGSILASDAGKFLGSLPGPAIYIGDISEKDYLNGYELINGTDKKPNLVVIKKL